MKVKQIVFKHTDMQRETKTYLYLGLAEIKKKLRFQLGLLTKVMHEPWAECVSPGLFCIGVCILRVSCRSLLSFHCNNGGHSAPGKRNTINHMRTLMTTQANK